MLARLLSFVTLSSQLDAAVLKVTAFGYAQPQQAGSCSVPPAVGRLCVLLGCDCIASATRHNH